MPLHTRLARLSPAAVMLALALPAGCGGPAPSEAVAMQERCLAIDGTILSLAWSQTGAFLAVGGTDGHDGEFAQVVTSAGTPFGEVIHDRGLVPSSVVVDPVGRLSWINNAASDVIVEDRAAGRRRIALPAEIRDIRWTAVGYALLESSENDETGRVLLLDPARDDAPTVITESHRHPTDLWISADPEQLLLTTARLDEQGEVVVGFEVSGSTATAFIEPAGADLSGASMPGLRQHVVFRTTPDRRIRALRLGSPDNPIVMDDRPVRTGAISDHGLLALALEAPPGMLCLVDVAERLR